MNITPELYCTDIEATRNFYTKILKMDIKYERRDEKFVYFTRSGTDLMVEQIDGNGRRWITDKLEKPFGRGVNFQWKINDLDSLYENVLAKEPNSIYLKLEHKEYQCGSKTVKQRQFVIQDPDGYLFRFCS